MENRYEPLFKAAAEAARALRSVPDATVSELLRNLASRIERHTGLILQANQKEIGRASCRVRV